MARRPGQKARLLRAAKHVGMFGRNSALAGLQAYLGPGFYARNRHMRITRDDQESYEETRPALVRIPTVLHQRLQHHRRERCR